MLFNWVTIGSGNVLVPVWQDGNLVIIKPVNVLAPHNARPSAGTVLTTELCICYFGISVEEEL